MPCRCPTQPYRRSRTPRSPSTFTAGSRIGLCRINKAKGVKVSWKNLREQFGQEYADPRNFKKAFRDALRRSCAVYHDARIEDTTGGLLLLPSKPPIPKTAILIDAANPLKSE
jgi:hypothetical protein